MATKFGSQWMFVSGVFNGKKSQSHRAHIPAPINVKPARHLDSMALDFEYGMVEEIYRWPRAHGIQRTYFHRALPHVVVTELELDNSNGKEELSVDLFDTSPTHFADLHVIHWLRAHGHSCANLTTRKAETPKVPLIGIALCRKNPPERAVVAAGETRRIVLPSTVWTSLDVLPTGFSSHWTAAQAELLHATQLAPGELFDQHLAAMRQLWRGGIEIEGNPALAKTVNSSWWNLLLSYREGENMSSSPGGLANNCYRGHTFWDVEQFMWPNLLMFYPAFAAGSLQYRADRREAAAALAKMWRGAGLKFPWESALTGAEVCPWFNGRREIHISGDVSLAFWQYWLSTGDKAWLAEVGWPVLRGIAEFWAHRTAKLPNGSLSIRNVIDVDEHAGAVSDSAYTNAVAKLALDHALEASRILGREQSAGPSWRRIARELPIPLAGHHHPEFPGAAAGNGLGVIMMQYPLGMPTAWSEGWTDSVRRRDLEFYASLKKTANAMFWWVFAILWLELGEPERAADYLQKTTAHNVWGPFHIWSEKPDGGGCPNFVTGAGAYLQVFWAGYAGIRLTKDSLDFHWPRLPPKSKGLVLRALAYRGSFVNVKISGESISLQLHEDSPEGAPELAASHSSHGRVFVLNRELPILLPSLGTTSLRISNDAPQGAASWGPANSPGPGSGQSAVTASTTG